MASPRASGAKAAPVPFYLGGIASCVAAVCTHPLDLIKVRMQTAKAQAVDVGGSGSATAATPATGSTLNGAKQTPIRRGAVATGIAVVRQEGILKLYAGLTAALLRQATYSTVRFGAYDAIKDAVGDSKERPLGAMGKVFVGMLAGAAGGVCGSPADIVNIRMQNDGRLPPASRRNYKHAIDGLVRISREEGVPVLWRGAGANVARAMLMTAAQLATYDIFKGVLLRTSYFKDDFLTYFCSSLLAGFVATTITSPFDVIKTRVMNAPKGEATNAVSVFTTTLRQEGPMALMKGWVPAYVRLGPHTIITFLTLEQLKRWHRDFTAA